MATVRIRKTAGDVTWTVEREEHERVSVVFIDDDAIDDGMVIKAIEKLAKGPGGKRWGELLE